MDDSIKQALLSRFQTYLDTVEAGAEAETPESGTETSDLYSLFVEVAGLRSEVRTESRLVKEALDQFRGVFDMLQANQANLQQELDRERSTARNQADVALRPLLLEVVDLRDRLLAALKFAAKVHPGWVDRLLRRPASDDGTWQEGLRMTLRRLDQMLLDRRVVPVQMVGLPFDPRHARVVATVADGSVEGTVLEEVRTGFLWNDQVLRTAEVVVSKSAAESGERA